MSKRLIYYDTCSLCGKDDKPTKLLSDVNEYYTEDNEFTCIEHIDDEKYFKRCSCCHRPFLIEDLEDHDGMCEECKDQQDIYDEVSQNDDDDDSVDN